MKTYYLELSEEELMDTELALMTTINNIKKNPSLKKNLISVLTKIKQLQAGEERDLEKYC